MKIVTWSYPLRYSVTVCLVLMFVEKENRVLGLWCLSGCDWASGSFTSWFGSTCTMFLYADRNIFEVVSGCSLSVHCSSVGIFQRMPELVCVTLMESVLQFGQKYAHEKSTGGPLVWLLHLSSLKGADTSTAAQLSPVCGPVRLFLCPILSPSHSGDRGTRHTANLHVTLEVLEYM